MRTKKTSKRALLVSCLSIVVSVALLLGTTFAWFTASVTNTGNKIEAGTLNISLYEKQEDGSYTDISASTTPLFKYDKWEPGYTAVKALQLRTAGTLALKYQVVFKGLETLDAATKGVENVLDVTVNGVKIGTLADFANGTSAIFTGTMIPAENKTSADLNIQIHMQETADNTYQGAVLPDFDVQIDASQYTYEADGFGSNRYDATATPSFDLTATVNHVAGKDTKVIDEAGLTVTVSSAQPTEQITATVQATSVEKKEASTVLSLEISVKNSSDTDVPATIVYDLGKNLTDVQVQHNGVAMASADYSYDAATGIVTIQCTSYSPYTIAFMTNDQKEEYTHYSAVTIDGVAGLEGKVYNTFDEAYAAFHNLLNLTVGANGDNNYNAIFTGDSITWTIYGDQTILEANKYPFAGGISQFDGGKGYELKAINIIGGNSIAGLTCGGKAFAHVTYTQSKIMTINFSSLIFTKQAYFGMPYGDGTSQVTFNFDKCKFRDQLYFYRNAVTTVNVTNSSFTNDGSVGYAFLIQDFVDKCDFSNNNVVGYSRGINIQIANADVSIKNNTIQSQNSVTDRGAIQLTDAAKGVVEGNTVAVSAGNAFWFHSGATNTNVNYEIKNNTITALYLANDDTKFGIDGHITSSGNTLNITYPGKCMKKEATTATDSTVTAIK